MATKESIQHLCKENEQQQQQQRLNFSPYSVHRYIQPLRYVCRNLRTKLKST